MSSFGYCSEILAFILESIKFINSFFEIFKIFGNTSNISASNNATNFEFNWSFTISFSND